ncbi:MAG: hypothetical protein R3D90_07370 [Paracoccaceae bacterium]
MQIQTRNRKSATDRQPKGRALFALADRREAPFAAIFAGLVIGMAAWVKSAFGGAPVAGAEDAGTPAMPAAADAKADPAAPLPPGQPVAPLPADVDMAAPRDLHPAEAVEDLGRVGRGPGMLDLSRFFPREDPALDLPALFGGDPGAGPPGLASPGPQPTGAAPHGAGAALASAAGPGSAGPGSAGSGSVGGTPATDPALSPDPGPIAFEDLFARLAQVVSPFGPETLRDIGTLAIGDWISQHELRRLRGEDAADPALIAFRLREDRSHDLLSNPDSREAFLQSHFPAADPDAPPTTAMADADADEASSTSLVPDSPAGLL